MGNYRTWAQNADANPLSAQLAERDAEIARLGTEVEDMVGQIAYLNRQLNEANQIVRAGEAERKALAAQVAELQAWKDAVPMWALQLTHDRGSHIDTDEFESAWDVVHTWLFPDDEPDDVPHAINPFVDGDE